MTRRGLAKGVALALGGGPAAAHRASAAASRVRLESLQIVRVPVSRRGGWVLVRLRTNQGVTGVGDASHGRDETVLACLRTLMARMKGKPFTAVEELRRLGQPLAAQHGVSGSTAASAIEQAMWDIAGKVFGVPARELFGGTLQTRLRNYANINRAAFDRSPAGFARWAEDAVKNGFDAIKLAPFDGFPQGDGAAVEAHIRNGIACVRAVRKVVGDAVDILVDAHSNFTLERGLQLVRELEPFRLYWLEEVCRGIPQLARIHEAAAMPTAGGESLIGVRGFYPYVRGGAVDIAMPDVKYCGGMLEVKKISAMAEGAEMPVSPHGPASPIGNVAAGQVCATLPNFQILEFAYGEAPWRPEIVEPPEQLERGHLLLSAKPGLGLDWNDRTLRRRGETVAATS